MSVEDMRWSGGEVSLVSLGDKRGEESADGPTAGELDVCGDGASLLVGTCSAARRRGDMIALGEDDPRGEGTFGGERGLGEATRGGDGTVWGLAIDGDEDVRGDPSI